MSEEFKEIRGEKHLRASRLIWDMIGQYAVPDTVAVESSMLLSLSTVKHMSMASRAILSNFFEEQ